MADHGGARHQLTAPQRDLLRAAVSAHPRGLLSDFDGTLSAIAPTPEAATLLPGVRTLLAEVVRTFDVVAVVSGRSAANLRRKVDVTGVFSIGNHGFEWLDPSPSPTGADEIETGEVIMPEGVERYLLPISAVLEQVYEDLEPRWPGLRAEPKGATASLHVRATQDPETAEAEVFHAAQAAAAPHGLRVTRGKRVVEIRPPVDVNKGTAIEALIRERGLRGAVYLGDDTTDIDAFTALRRLTRERVCTGVSVAVLQAEAPSGLADAADVTLPSIQQVPSLLRWLIDEAARA